MSAPNVCLAGAMFLFCSVARAQELEVFDPIDFLDPRDRGAVFSDRLLGVDQKGDSFLLMRVYAGRVEDYQWRTTATDANLTFVHLTSSFYHGDKQLTMKVTGFHADDESNLPSYRASFQIGQYIAGRTFGVRDKDADSRVSGRILGTWSIEQNPFRSDPGVTRRDTMNHELGVQADVRMPLPRWISKREKIDGSFIWMRRWIDDETYLDRLSYVYRFRERRRSNHRLQLNANLGFGAERAEGWHCCAIRLAVVAGFTIPRVDTRINVALAPAFSPSSRGRRTHTELAVYVDRTLFAKLYGH